ncbi:MAG: hypothetical protein JXA04_04030 [Gammaproteobacteria bacterium]|nr:hypothetical protein [Gammaproteobacteria bacterium]
MDKINLELAIPEVHPCYSDHFPGNPLVPGALLLQWIFNKIQTAYLNVVITEVKSAKFYSAVRPGDSCNLEICYAAEISILSVDCMSNSRLACRCKMIVRENEIG